MSMSLDDIIRNTKEEKTKRIKDNNNNRNFLKRRNMSINNILEFKNEGESYNKRTQNNSYFRNEKNYNRFENRFSNHAYRNKINFRHNKVR